MNATDSFATWVSAPLSSGTAVLVGVGLLVLAALLVLVYVAVPAQDPSRATR